MTRRFTEKKFFYQNFSSLFKIYVFIGLMVISVFFFWYTQQLNQNIRENDQRYIRLFAQFSTLAPLINDENLNTVFENVREGLTFPVIVTDQNNQPSFWRNIDLPQDSAQIIPYLKDLIRKMDEKNPPKVIELNIDDGYKLVQYLHYGESSLIHKLKWYSIELIIIIASFFVFGVWIFKIIKHYEQSFVWVGLAKETAHQLGTPVSSLMGWNELLAAYAEDNPEVQNVTEQIGLDLQRLVQISNRFNKIGSDAELVPIDINLILHKSCDYFKGRLPQFSKNIMISDHYHPGLPQVAGNPILLEWAFENIIKNAMDAVHKKDGLIEVYTEPDPVNPNRIHIYFKDNGKGIPGSHHNKIFYPGFSTKKIGWGLGLSLVKRIIEEYHSGKVSIKESAPSKGTILQITLKALPSPKESA
ncbi:MAG: HAMP domain-containing histidine kinase [Candidatus Delongbacteria bacterium]|nr:HAMP domain-containing histidine kinase [Candidatus Delongbacteria bacterium]